jgi:hydroxyacid-oxoacid transhydrogenase
MVVSIAAWIKIHATNFPVHAKRAQQRVRPEKVGLLDIVASSLQFATMSSMQTDTAFQMAMSNIRFGTGITREVGMDLVEGGLRRVMLVIDPALVNLPAGATVIESLRSNRVDYALYDQVRVEPTDAVFQAAARFATEGGFDGLVAVGGGSTIDTAKAANLYSTYPADFLEYVNAPIGRGKPVPGPVKPLIAIPTTAGTGSETTGTAIFDMVERKMKTGIAHRHLKPLLGLVDADNTRTQPAAVAASAGLDVLSHALESYTALPFNHRPRPARPNERPAYQGANPISDIWSLRALEIVAEFLDRAVADPSDDEARGQMLLAAAIAGIGFGNAGVHLPHGMSYPVAGLVRDFLPAGYRVDHPMVPHGMSVILNTPAVVKFTAPACPERHLRAAQALGADVAGATLADAGKILAECVITYMQKLKMPNGLAAVGYSEADIPALVQGTLPQHRVTKLSPKPASEGDLAGLFRESLKIW